MLALQTAKLVHHVWPLLEDLGAVASLEFRPRQARVIGVEELVARRGVLEPGIGGGAAHTSGPLAHHQHAIARCVECELAIVDAGFADHTRFSQTWAGELLQFLPGDQLAATGSGALAVGGWSDA